MNSTPHVLTAWKCQYFYTRCGTPSASWIITHRGMGLRRKHGKQSVKHGAKGRWVFSEGSVRGCSITFAGSDAPILHCGSHYPALSPLLVPQSAQALLLLNGRENTRIQLKIPSALLETKNWLWGVVRAVCLGMCCISQRQPSPCWQALFAFPNGVCLCSEQLQKWCENSWKKTFQLVW